ncbi:unnamed protein product [Phytophthora lilii]|uniref:Unnamed protein product n=1 Tax=Phytophthora lilii TaxID=2077276 RepID=A0A9W6TYT9_9STRA|nr:unnamed protein product [Phytophthora lilii]
MPSEAKESKKDGDAGSDAKRARAAFDVDEDETVLPDDAKKPPMRASIGWGNETTLASDEKEGGGTPDPDATPAATGSSTSEAKRVGRRRKGSEATGSSGGDRRNQKNRYFEEDDETTGATQHDANGAELEAVGQRHQVRAAECAGRFPVALRPFDQVNHTIVLQTHGVDLHLLTSALCPERAVRPCKEAPTTTAPHSNSHSQVYEEDEPWDFDTLLNDIAQEIQMDLDEKEEFVRLGSQESLHLAP